MVQLVQGLGVALAKCRRGAAVVGAVGVGVSAAVVSLHHQPRQHRQPGKQQPVGAVWLDKASRAGRER